MEQCMRNSILRGALLGALITAALVATAAQAAGEKYAVYGADTTPAQRQELARLFGVTLDAQPQTVTTSEMLAALQNSGLPVAATDKSISSAGLTCLNKGDGLTVQTQNITRITAPVYANALVTAGVGDAGVLVAAPADDPVTGETALVGVLKAFPQCQAGKQPEASRVGLAFQQVAWTTALAGPSGDLNKAADVMLKVAQPVITGTAKDDTQIGAALDQAAQSDGNQVDPTIRAGILPFFKALGNGIDYGTYAKGYQVQQVSPTSVKIVAAGTSATTAASGTPAAAAATAATRTVTGTPAAATVAVAAGTVTGTPAAVVAAASRTATSTTGAAAAGAAALTTFSGTVKDAGTPLTVSSSGQDRKVTPAPNLVVTRNGKNAQLADIKKDDAVTVTADSNNVATRIDATSKKGAGFNPLWLLLLLLLIPLLLLLLGRRKKDSFVLERETGGAAAKSTGDDFTIEKNQGGTGNQPRP